MPVVSMHRYGWEDILRSYDIHESVSKTGSVHLFVISAEIYTAAAEIAFIEKSKVSKWEELSVPVDAKRHGEVTILAVELLNGGYSSISLGENSADPVGHPQTVVSFVSNVSGTTRGIGAYVPGGLVGISSRFASDDGLANAFCDLIFQCSIIMSLINQPNITSVSPALSRQQRRAMARSGKPSSGSLSIVRWNIGEGAKARALAASGGKPRALHWRRGHWRRAEQHYHGAVQRSEGGWWQWIEGMWVGHPAFGVIKSIHAPQIAS